MSVQKKKQTGKKTHRQRVTDRKLRSLIIKRKKRVKAVTFDPPPPGFKGNRKVK